MTSSHSIRLLFCRDQWCGRALESFFKKKTRQRLYWGLFLKKFLYGQRPPPASFFFTLRMRWRMMWILLLQLYFSDISNNPAQVSLCSSQEMSLLDSQGSRSSGKMPRSPFFLPLSSLSHTHTHTPVRWEKVCQHVLKWGPNDDRERSKKGGKLPGVALLFVTKFSCVREWLGQRRIFSLRWNPLFSYGVCKRKREELQRVGAVKYCDCLQAFFSAVGNVALRIAREK